MGSSLEARPFWILLDGLDKIQIKTLGLSKILGVLAGAKKA